MFPPVNIFKLNACLIGLGLNDLRHFIIISVISWPSSKRYHNQEEIPKSLKSNCYVVTVSIYWKYIIKMIRKDFYFADTIHSAQQIISNSDKN